MRWGPLCSKKKKEMCSRISRPGFETAGTGSTFSTLCQKRLCRGRRPFLNSDVSYHHISLVELISVLGPSKHFSASPKKKLESRRPANWIDLHVSSEGIKYDARNEPDDQRYLLTHNEIRLQLLRLHRLPSQIPHPHPRSPPICFDWLSISLPCRGH